MRIALVISSLEPGGAQRVMVTLANELVQGHSVSLVKLSRLPDHYELDERVDVREVDYGVSSRIARILVGRFRILWHLRRALRVLQPEVVLSFLDVTNVRVLLATRRMGVPVVVSERIDPAQHRIKIGHRVLRRFVYSRAHAVVFQTERAANWGRSFLSEHRIRVIPNPVALDHAAPDRRQTEVVAVGRLTRQKGFDVLLRAFERTEARRRGWRLRVVGDGPDRRALLDLAAQLGIDEAVTLEGVVPDPRPYLRRAGMFVLASRYEGFPNVLLEAMACAAACISTDCPSGPAEILDDGRTGLLVPVEDVRALSSAIDKLSANEPLRERMGAAARIGAERFAVDRIGHRWEALLVEAATVIDATDS